MSTDRNRRKKASLAIIALALGALFVDRFLLDGGESPAPAVADDATSPVRHDHAASPDAEGLSIPELPFPRSLPDAAHRILQRDLFAFPAVDAADSESRRGNTRLSDAETFAAGHRLEAVLSDGQFAIAVVNGMWLRIGHRLDGCTLTRIERTRAYFSCGKDQAVLDLEKSDPGS